MNPPGGDGGGGAAVKTVEVHLYSQSEPCKFGNVRNAYTKDGLYCVWTLARADGTPEQAVYKFPVQHIFRIKESV